MYNPTPWLHSSDKTHLTSSDMTGTLFLKVLIQILCASSAARQNMMMKKKSAMLDYPNAIVSGDDITISNAINLTITDADIYHAHPETTELIVYDCPNLQMEDHALFGLTQLSHLFVQTSQLKEAPNIDWVGSSLGKFRKFDPKIINFLKL